MSQKNDWDESTPPRVPATLLRLTAAEAGQAKAHKRIDSLDEGFGRVMGELGEMRADQDALADQLTNLRSEVKAGFSRMGALLDDLRSEHQRDQRKTEDSQADLSAEVQKAKRIAAMKSVSWPTAVVVSVMVLCYCGLLALNIQPPTWLVGLVGALGTALAGFLPALLGAGSDKSP